MSKVNGDFSWKDSVTLKEYFKVELDALRTSVDDRDRLYSSQFKASEIAVNAALAAQEKAVAAAFLASEKAIVKAEDAQKDYNQRSNEFRGQLDDQAKTLMPRVETMGLFKAIDERITIINKDLSSIHELQSEGRGRFSQTSADSLISRTQWVIIFGIVSSLVGISGLVITLIRMSLGK